MPRKQKMKEKEDFKKEIMEQFKTHLDHAVDILDVSDANSIFAKFTLKAIKSAEENEEIDKDIIERLTYRTQNLKLDEEGQEAD